MKQIFLDNFQVHDNTIPDGFFVRPNGLQGVQSPTFRLASSERPATDGSFVANQLYGGRAITLLGKIYAEDQITYRARRRAFLLAIRRKIIDGVLTPIYLRFTTMDDLMLRLPIFTEGSPDFEDARAFDCNYKVNFSSPSVYLESQELHSATIFIFSGGGMAIPMGIPMDMSVGGSSASSVVNAGDVESYPILTFYGEMEDPSLVNQTNGETISIAHDLESGERIVIDTERHTALFYSTPDDPQGDNVVDEISGDWMKLDAGNNTLKLISAVSNNEGSVNIQWRDKYQGV